MNFRKYLMGFSNINFMFNKSLDSKKLSNKSMNFGFYLINVGINNSNLLNRKSKV